MSYLALATRKQLIADPTQIAPLYNSMWSQFAADLQGADFGNWMSNGMLASCFASVVANDLKPYGAENLANFDTATLLAAPTLACDGFVALAWQLMKLIPQCAGMRVRAVGWDNSVEFDDPVSPVSNHAQMFVSDGGNWVMLDPTIGLVVKAKYRDVAAGVALDMTKSTTFCTRFQTDPVKTPFAGTVNTALANGSYRPCHALYFCAAFDLFCHLPDEALWPTPSAARFQT